MAPGAADDVADLVQTAMEEVIGAGQHDVNVSFVNDAYGGTSYTDRNLFVQGVSRLLQSGQPRAVF